MRKVGVCQAMALTKPMAVSTTGRERTVPISAEEFHRLERRDQRAISADDLTESQIEALRQTKFPDRYAPLDDELEDWRP
jgi:hypothetical protein